LTNKKGVDVLKFSKIMMVLFTVLIAGCSTTDSFEGYVFGTDNNILSVDCSEVVNKGKNNVETIGYLCSVEINEKTEIMTENEGSLSLNDLKDGQKIKVILAERRSISKSVESREVTAKKIVIVSD
jgi:hypothetical protein